MILFTKPRASVRAMAVARAISLTGGAAAYLALNYHIFQLTHSAAWVSAALFVTFGTEGLLMPVAGALGDRFDRQRLMIYSDLAGAVLFFVMALVRSPVALLVMAFFTAVAEAPFWSASSAAIPALVGEEDIPWANSMAQVGFNSGMMVGPVVGGLLVASIGTQWVFAINAISFAISAGLVALVRGRFRETRSAEEEEQYRGIRAGFVFVLRDRVLRTISVAWFVVVLGMGIAMVADVPLARLFHTGSIGYGLIITAWGTGSLFGSLLGRLLNASTEGKALVYGTGATALLTASIGVSPWFAPILVAVLGAGIFDGLTVVGEQGIIQRRAPDAVRSRVIAATHTTVHIAFAVAFACAGIVVGMIGAKGAYLIAGAATAIGFAILLPILRELRASSEGPAMGEAPESP